MARTKGTITPGRIMARRLLDSTRKKKERFKTNHIKIANIFINKLLSSRLVKCKGVFSN